MPAQVLRSAAVGVEFTASAVTSEIESQHVELTPGDDLVELSIQLGGVTYPKCQHTEHE